MENLTKEYRDRFSNKLNKLIEGDYWMEAKDMLEKESQKYPNEYFLLTSLAKVYYNLGLYEKSLEYATKAMEIEPNDVLVIYDYGCALSAQELHEKSIEQFNRIIEMEISEIAYGIHGEGLKWAKSIKNDARYRKAISKIAIGQTKIAIQLIEDHLLNRKRGIYSDFTKPEILKKLRFLKNIVS